MKKIEDAVQVLRQGNEARMSAEFLTSGQFEITV
jgi:hypothetical protein